MGPSNDILQALCGLLREGRDVERCAAAQALGELRQKAAVDTLIDGLSDEDEDVRIDAALALKSLGDPRAGPALLESLVEDPVGEVKVAAVAALSHLRHAAAIPILRELVRGRDGSVLWDEEEFLSGGWDDWLDVQVNAIEALGEMGAAEAVADVVAAADEEMGQDLGPVAFRALARLGRAGLAALAAGLRTGKERQRRHAAEALREHGSQAACETLAIALDDQSAAIRSIVLSALATQNPGDPRLEALLGDPDPAVRGTAVRLIGRHWPERLERLLDDPDEEVQAQVVRLVSADGAAPDLTDLEFRLRVKMRGPSKQVAAAACQAVARVAPERALSDLSEQLRDSDCPAVVRRAAARGLATLGSREAVKVLGAAVDDDHREVRTETIAALAEVARSGPVADAARSLLLQALRGELVPPPEAPAMPESEQHPAPSQDEPKGTDDGVQEPSADHPWPTTTLEAITGDTQGPDARITPPQTADLDEKDLELLALTTTRPRRKHVSLNPPVIIHQDVRQLAALVLGDVSSVDVAEALAIQLDGEDLELRRRAADSLARVGFALGGLPESVRDALLAALDNQDRDLRLAAARALGATSEQAVAALTDCLDDHDCFVRAEAARALAALGAASGALHKLLSDDYPGVRQAAAEAIARLGGRDALACLMDFAFAHEGMHAVEAARLLRGLDRDAANGRLLAILSNSSQQRNWRIAIDVLKTLNRPGSEPAPRLVA